MPWPGGMVANPRRGDEEELGRLLCSDVLQHCPMAEGAPVSQEHSPRVCHHLVGKPRRNKTSLPKRSEQALCLFWELPHASVISYPEILLTLSTQTPTTTPLLPPIPPRHMAPLDLPFRRWKTEHYQQFVFFYSGLFVGLEPSASLTNKLIAPKAGKEISSNF